MKHYSITDFTSLKEDSFIYCGKNYKQSRWISKDRKIYLTRDDLSYLLAYSGNKDGLANRFYLRNNETSYPFYDLETFVKELNNLNIELPNLITVNESHYKSKNKKTALDTFLKAVKHRAH